jgi:uncharacterized protein YbjT (DUF2867 family)
MAADLPGLAVTGATGGLGGMVARELADAGFAQRLLVRDPSRAPDLEQAAAAVCSYGDADAARRALEGVRVLFMVSAAEAEDRLQQHFAFVDAAAGAGVEHVVYTSFYGAAPDATFTLARDHYATEERIRSSGMDYTFLRDNFYLDFLPLMTDDQGVIRGPAGDGVFSGVAREDIARSAVAVLRDPAIHKGKTYQLTGPEELTMARAAEIISEGTGRNVTYQAETLEEAYASRAPYNAPKWQVDAWVSTYTAMAAGEMAGVSPDIHGLTGRDPISLAEFLTRPVL